mmetsp:Transcript_29229/g.58804  ORF Transcript_29229/g.58804 Transcript_29229/m.58804 type:complete len:1061 (+) Transcript_29229:47-3229(+)
MMLHQSQLLSRNITTAARQSTLISRFLCSAIGSRGGDTEIDKKNKPRARSDYYYNVIRPARSSGGGGGKESHNRLRPPGNVLEKKSNSSFQDGNLRRLDTFSRGGNIIRGQHQHGSRSDIFPRNSNTQKSPPIKYNNFKSNYTPETAENKQLYQSIIKCKTIKDTVAVAHDHLDKLSPKTTAAVWKHISLLLSKPHHNNSNAHVIDEQLKKQLDVLLSHTSNQIAAHNPTVLANTAHALASIVKTTTLATNNKKHNGSINQLFHNLLLNDHVTIWNKLQHRYIETEESFGARQIVTLAWSFATVLEPITRNNNHNSSLLNVAPFFSAAYRTFQSKSEDFSTKHLVNLAWSCMTCKHSMPALFNELSDEFISRRLDPNEAEYLDAVTLCQLASSFAKARHNDARLFQAIAQAVLPILHDFNGRHLANLIQPFAFAKIVPELGDDGRILFDEVAKISIFQVKSLAPQNMANILWAYATTEQSHPALFDAIAQEAAPRLKEFSPKQLANLAWALSKYPPPQSKDHIFDRIASEVVHRGLESFTNQGLTMIAHSFATVGHTSHDEFWSTVEGAAADRAPQFGHLECVQMAWSFATIDRPSDELFCRIERVAISNTRAFNSQGLSNLSWAFSTLGYDSLPIFQAIADSSMRKMNEFKPTEKAMLVLSFSRISHPFQSLFDKVASRSVSELKSFGSLDLFNIVVSYSKADASKRNKKLLKAIADEIVSRPSSLSPKMLVGIAWSYANEGFRDPKLFNFISKECLGYCASFDSQEIASLAWSFVSVGCRDRLLLQSLSEKSDDRWEEFGAQPLANMAWAYATAEEDRPSLFEGIADSAIAIQNDFTSQGVSNLLWAFSAAGYPEQRLFQSLATPASSVLCEAGHQSLANIAWAYSVANVEDSSLFNKQFVNVCVQKEHDFDYQGLRQLHQWNLWRKELKSDIALPHDLGTRCYNEFMKQTLISSDLQKQVVSVLHSVGLIVDEEVQTKSGYVLDATFIHNGKVIGLEIDGPSHFIGKKKKGNTILKERQVANVDLIPLISVPYWEWSDLVSLEDKESYILNKIDQTE